MRLTSHLAPKSGGIILACLLVASLFSTRAAQDNLELSITMSPAGEAETLIKGRTGEQYWIETSGDLHTWVKLSPLVRNTESVWTYRTRAITPARYFRARTLVLTEDSDADGINDGDELRFPDLLNPLDAKDALEDPDYDSVTNRDELSTHGTNPSLSDTDSDGWSDGFEVAAETDPRSRVSRPAVFARSAVDLVIPKNGNGSAIHAAVTSVDVSIPLNGNSSKVYIAEPEIEIYIPFEDQ